MKWLLLIPLINFYVVTVYDSSGTEKERIVYSVQGERLAVEPAPEETTDSEAMDK